MNKSAYLAALLYAFIIGFSFFFIKLALTTAGPVDILAHRFTIAFLAALFPLLFGWVNIRLRFKDVLVILPLALFYPVMFFAFQVFGLVYTSSSEAGIIQAAIPIFTMILASYVLKERFTKRQFFFTVLSAAGVACIFFMKNADAGGSDLRGAALILLSALSSAGYNVLARKMTRTFSSLEITYVTICAGFLFFNGIAGVEHMANGTLAGFFTPYTDPVFLLAILYLGVLSSLATSFLSNYALSKIEAAKISMFNHLATLVTILAGILWLGETLEWFHFLGSVMIITGIIGATAIQSKKKYANS
ncbi:DMT family transporter [Bacillus swezeyi]|uniref:EamA family transporter n=1 Tax=Bacillus swezeyi TaxID=1925020 RepID=A0A1R1QP69_9BACI|nr:DMT family transporter [Bacillus swezeyi]MEC1260140.1 DMT family transporter [Bacillus swezeyi]MED1738748.1 DMT family transporter [Bacillus swezeyi]MED2927057.1 DMT family transporter [Bacillus swezeyi]MED2942670.1 DMT family transporter [Bacillus swezeyi]MED2964839.1 DMT family transporter [Bacillus swezeyi]